MSALTPAARALAGSHVANVLGFTPAPGSVADPVLEQVFRELSRTPETETPVRDLWGNWDFSYGESNLRGQLYEPWIDKLVLTSHGVVPPGTRREPPWPDGKPFAVCLTHDVDLVTHNVTLAGAARIVGRHAGLLRRGARDAAVLRNLVRGVYLLGTFRWLRSSKERTYDRWLKVEDRFGFKSTFFFFPERLSDPHVYDCLYSFDDLVDFDGRRLRVGEMIREIVRAGWDVGLHGSYHSALRPGLLADQKRQIETASGQPVTGTRQHWLHYDVRRTPKLQAEAGLLADSTQGFNRNIGFRAGTAFPYPCWDFDRGEPLPVLEIPQHVMDAALFTANALEYDASLALRHCLQLMDAVHEVGGCLTLSWHPNTLEYPGYWEVYESLLAEASRRGAWGCSVGELRRWWTERAARIAARRQEASVHPMRTDATPPG